MCGRYFVKDDTADDVERVLMKIASDRGAGTPYANGNGNALRDGSQGYRFISGDVHPTDLAGVIRIENHVPRLSSVRWGLPGFHKGHVIFNARSEGALEKPAFRKGLMTGRIVIPAAGFYEWNARKEKNVFLRKDGRSTFMAGFCLGTAEDERFTILTTAANDSMKPVHDRMPLILEEDEIGPWLYDPEHATNLLKKVPVLLERRTDYEQMSLFS